MRRDEGPGPIQRSISARAASSGFFAAVEPTNRHRFDRRLSYGLRHAAQRQCGIGGTSA